MPKPIDEPNVYLVGRPCAVGKNLLKFLEDEGVAEYFPHADRAVQDSPAQALCEIAGRLCYMSFRNPRPGGTSAYFQNIIESGHGSILEHANWNFIITGVSRSFTHELVRHRAGFAYSQLSQRYVDESEANHVVPPAMQDSAACGKGTRAILQAAVREARAKYTKFVEDHLACIENPTTADVKAARQAARAVLPACIETKIFVTANARALRHFIELRGSRHADREIRKVAFKILEIMQDEAPALFGDYSIELGDSDQDLEVKTSNRKV